MNFATILSEIKREVTPYQLEGTVASYIPELANVNPSKFGIHLLTTEEEHFAVGDSEEKFSIQSISKVLSLTLALSIVGESIWKRIGVEPSGNPFNSIVQLEYEQGVPRNPFVNAGALVTADILVTILDHPKEDFLQFIRMLANAPDITFDARVAESERQHRYKNAALANMLKSYGNIQNEIEVVLDFYFHQCAVAMSCHELACAFLPFANRGRAPHLEKPVLSQSQVKRLNALMQTCGFYDEAGDFSFKVGLPGKSGVGGGIVAVHPQHYSVAVWSPKLNKKGNSVLGLKSLELLTTKTGMSIF